MNDPYVYKGTNVLINKLNIKDEKALDQAETAYAIFVIDELKKSDFTFNSIFDGLKIHKAVFSDIYERVLNINKENKTRPKPGLFCCNDLLGHLSEAKSSVSVERNIL